MKAKIAQAFNWIKNRFQKKTTLDVPEQSSEVSLAQRWKRWRFWFWVSPIVVAICLQAWMKWGYQGRIYQDVALIPERPVALLLGTAKTFQGVYNLYYIYRIEAAAKLYHSGKIRGILISGDNGSVYYDEPTAMREDLMAKGVSPEHISLDYAGFRTLDSVVRAEKIFGVTDYILVSQAFHCQRAMFLGDAYGHQALCFEAQDVPLEDGGAPIQQREILARFKAMLDLVTFKQPRFLGSPESLHLKPKLD